MSTTRLAAAFGLLACALASPLVLAQGIHRIVGPDGRVTYSDLPPAEGQAKPPAADEAASPTPSAAASSTGTSGGPPLPFALRQVSSRYPVTLYTTNDCAPCNSGRNLLNARGIPYSEKTVNTPQDTEALQRIAGDASLPLLTIGSQHIKGYVDAQWTQYLDAAGYPPQSQLPASYRRPAAQPLVALKEAPTARAAGNNPPAAAPTSATRKAPSPPVVPVAPPVTNPAGIRF